MTSEEMDEVRWIVREAVVAERARIVEAIRECIPTVGFYSSDSTMKLNKVLTTIADSIEGIKTPLCLQSYFFKSVSWLPLALVGSST